MESGTDALVVRPNGRPSTQLLVNQQGREPLFTNAKSSRDGGSPAEKDDNDAAQPNPPRYRPPPAGDGCPLARRVKSESPSSTRRESGGRRIASPGNSRIPKLTPSTFSQRKPFSIAEAFRRAEEEGETAQEDDAPIDASPSPAPRTWRASRDADQNKLRKQLAEDHLDTKGHNKPSSKDPEKTGEEVDEVLPSDNGEPKKSSPLKTASKAVETGREPTNPTNNGPTSWRDRRDWRRRPRTGSEWFKELGSSRGGTNGGIADLVPGVEDMPLPSVEGAGRQGAASPSWRRTQAASKSASPEKSFAWQVDEDFTAGDLQISNSPRIKVDDGPFANRLAFDDNSSVDINSQTRVNNPGSRNTKLDEIRSREVKAGNNIPLERSQSRPRNTKLDDIRAREAEAEDQIPIPDRRLTTSRNTKLDDIRQREAEGLTRRQLANARLEEIREQNAMSRSKSPEDTRQPRENPQDERKAPGVVPETKTQTGPESSQWEPGGERIPDTPATVLKNRREKNGASKKDPVPSREGQKDEGDAARPGFSRRSQDSRDLLRQLSRATSSSPAPEKEVKRAPAPNRRDPPDSPAPPTRGPRRALTTNVTGRRRGNKQEGSKPGNGNGRPTVEFAGLRRVRSTESTTSKRSSMHSETDPTDRIEAEMKLFAPLDNHSEKGSVRAPSPSPDSKKDENEDDNVEATPKARRDDPLTMPTPKVTGAYVETPATVKVEKIGESDKDSGFQRPQEDAKSTKSEPVTSLRESRARSTRDDDAASDPGEDGKSDAIATSTRRRRPQSLPRRRRSLKNSAKLPSVKDDLQELQRTHNIDDSTLDDFEEILSGRKAAPPKLTALLQGLPDPPKDDSFDLKLDRMKEQSETGDAEPINAQVKESAQKQESAVGDLAAYDRMSKSLRTGLLGIRSAKQGIERLQGDLSRTEHQPSTEKMGSQTQAHTHDDRHEQRCPGCNVHRNPSAAAYVHVPVPRLYRREPHFRFTLLGVLTLIVTLWYALETSMCALYCAPASCTSTPCVWSYDDPTFGIALPVKVDQWATGGLGRTVFNNALEEAEDWVADMLDAAYGRDITDINVDGLSFQGKRAHRRRMRKKGLDTRAQQVEQDAAPEVRARWDSWRRERIAREKARDARALGYEPVSEDDESMGGDQRIF